MHNFRGMWIIKYSQCFLEVCVEFGIKKEEHELCLETTNIFLLGKTKRQKVFSNQIRMAIAMFPLRTLLTFSITLFVCEISVAFFPLL